MTDAETSLGNSQQDAVTVTFTMKLPGAVVTGLDLMARQTSRSRAGMIREILAGAVRREGLAEELLERERRERRAVARSQERSEPAPEPQRRVPEAGGDVPPYEPEGGGMVPPRR